MREPSWKGRCWIVSSTSSGGMRGEMRKLKYADGSVETVILHCWAYDAPEEKNVDIGYMKGGWTEKVGNGADQMRGCTCNFEGRSN